MGFERPEDTAAWKTVVGNAGDKLVFLQFSAGWCTPCQLIKDDMEKLSEEMADKYVFIYTDMDNCEEVGEVYQVANLPTFMVLKEKRPVD